MIDRFGEQTLESMNQANWYNQWTLNKIKRYLNGKILEVGCGIGNFTKSLIEYGEVYGIDIRKDYIEKTEKRLSGSNAKTGLGDIEKGRYFFMAQKFDNVICINVLEHIENDNQAIKNLYEVLKDKGILILLIPAHSFLFGEIDESIGHFRRYTKKDIKQKLENEGFRILQFKTLNMIGAIGWFFSGRILKNKIVDQSKIKLFNLLAPIFLRIEDFISPPFGTSFLIIAKKVS